MKRYYYHPDHMVYITNGDQTYFETLKFAKFDIGNNIVKPIQDQDELEYIQGYGTRFFNRQGLLSFDPQPNPILDGIIENIEVYIKKKNIRGPITDDVWVIPEDMR